jgi:outer membrane protein insertion porin family
MLSVSDSAYRSSRSGNAVLTHLALITLVAAVALLAVPCSGRLRVERVQFAGNAAFGSKELLNYVQTKPGGFFHRVYYDRRAFLNDLANLQRFYQSEGYLEANVELDDMAVSPDSTGVEILIGVYEGDRWLVDSVTFTGERQVSAEELRHVLTLKEGNPFRFVELEADRRALLDEYARRSYLDAKVTQEVVRDDEKRTAAISYEVTERERATIDSIDVVGDNKTRQFVVERELTFKPGEYFDFKKIGESQAKIYRTGLFSSVWIQPAEKDTGRAEKEVIVRVAERPSGEYDMSAAYAALEGFEVTGGVLNRNLQGQATTLGLRGSYGERLREARASVGDPWFLGLHVSVEASARHQWKKTESYTAETTGAGFVLSRHLNLRMTLEGGYQFERTIVLQAADDTEDIGTSYTSDLLFAVVYDSRNDVLNATRGTYLRAETDLASSRLGGTNDFVRVELDWRGYVRFGGDLAAGLNLRPGWIRPTGDATEVPVSERFLAGGEGSVRGFPRDSIGPLDMSGRPVGGRVRAIARGELRFRIYRGLGGVLFADAGQVSGAVSEFRARDLAVGAGLGLRFGTRLGVLRLDAAIPVSEDGKPQFYFSVGQAF